ncbi:MAG: amino acid ABC transporter permease [Defluviitaleaceae bacterium]|nr:amino acid ABC transporter permease [Defluviitaleaceae bacterium]
MFQNIWQILNDHQERLWTALGNTLRIAFLGFAFAFILGTLIALVRTNPSRHPLMLVAKKILEGYVLLIRGLPTTVQMLLWFFLIFPVALQVRMPAVVIAMIAFSVDGSAYISETIRGAVQSIDKGQMEAGRAAGLTNFQTMQKVILPQAFRNAIPQLGNELISMTKGTSVVGWITVMDLTFTTNLIVSTTFDVVHPYIILAVSYLIIVYILTFLIKILEKAVFKTNAFGKQANKNFSRRRSFR